MKSRLTKSKPSRPSRLEIARALSAIENRDPKTRKRLAKLFHKDSFRRTLCVTGPGGVGKSTLISRLSRHVSKTKNIAWLACDPSSVVTGGSLLGDRIRLGGLDLGSSVYVRSIATRSTQSFSLAIRDLEIYMESLFEEVWVETAGSGQANQEVMELSGLSLLVLQPETGDDIQWMKAGTKELSDLIVLNKSDLSGAETMARSLVESGIPEDRLIRVSSKTGEGIEALWNRIEEIRTQISWPRRLKILHQAHARALFFEAELMRIEKSFLLQSKRLSLSPYSSN